MSLAQLPNLITFLRLALVPVLILLLHDHDYRGALAVVVVAGISDGLDGFIARRFHFQTRLGGILDPLADKALLVSSYVMLVVLDQLPFWLVLAVVSRDVLIVGGYLVYTTLYGPVKARPSMASKVNTFLQIVLVVAVLAGQAGLIPLASLIEVLIPGVFVTTVVSGLHYFWSWTVLKDVQPAHQEKDE